MNERLAWVRLRWAKISPLLAECCAEEAEPSRSAPPERIIAAASRGATTTTTTTATGEPIDYLRRPIYVAEKWQLFHFLQLQFALFSSIRQIGRCRAGSSELQKLKPDSWLQHPAWCSIRAERLRRFQCIAPGESCPQRLLSSSHTGWPPVCLPARPLPPPLASQKLKRRGKQLMLPDSCRFIRLRRNFSCHSGSLQAHGKLAFFPRCQRH